MFRHLSLGLGIIAGGLLGTGCTNLGQGVTERQFNASWDTLTRGLPMTQVEAMLGPPREKQSRGVSEVWVYSRPEKVGERTEREEGAVTQSGTAIPTYQTRDVLANVEYHLHAQAGTLVSWERVVPD